MIKNYNKKISVENKTEERGGRSNINIFILFCGGNL
jgi:hypothetical protein